jgi:hypothetical protein
MKKNAFTIAVLLISSITLTSFTSDGDPLKKADVIATRTTVNGSSLISCDYTKLDDQIEIPLSYFVEELQMVRLENRDDALVGNQATTVTENYILVRNNKQNPYKLFDIKGKFIATIGGYGQGPNEYKNVYDDFICEKTNQIFILPWQSDKILRFNLKGEPLKAIPLPHRVPKGKFMVNTKDQTVTVMLLPFSNIPTVVWRQDFSGNVINSIPSGHLSLRPDFSNEVHSNKNTNAFDCSVFTFAPRTDSVYHYNSTKGQLDAKFTLDFKSKPLKMHWYEELPNHFLGTTSVPKQISENTSVGSEFKHFLIDKQSLKGAFYNLYNDYLGDIPLSWVSFYAGYYVWNIEPGDLIDILTKQLEENGDMSKKDRKKLTELLRSINENENNYVFYGKLKQ